MGQDVASRLGKKQRKKAAGVLPAPSRGTAGVLQTESES